MSLKGNQQYHRLQYRLKAHLVFQRNVPCCAINKDNMLSCSSLCLYLFRSVSNFQFMVHSDVAGDYIKHTLRTPAKGKKNGGLDLYLALPHLQIF